VLKRFLSGRGRLVARKSYKRVSRRFDDLPGSKRSVGVEALLAVDESGSVSDAMVRAFFDELGKINRINGVSLQVTAFDTECSAPVPLGSFVAKAGREKRGGTDFRPVFALADRLRIGRVIIFTDGDGERPESANQRTLWC
jgi:predicted metal-dependent peptidase